MISIFPTKVTLPHRMWKGHIEEYFFEQLFSVIAQNVILIMSTIISSAVTKLSFSVQGQ